MALMAALQSDLSVVVEKLRRHADFAHKSDGYLVEFADVLTNFEKMSARFSHLLEPVVDKAIDEVLVDYKVAYAHQKEYDMAHERAKYGLARVFHLPVKLFLSRLRQPIPLYSIAGKISKFFLEYGALHAGLVVGNIRIEWGQESIVEALPEEDIPGDDFVGSVDKRQGALARIAEKIHRDFSLADRERRIDEKIKLIIDSAEEKKGVIDNLVRVITRYNREKHYDLFKCNCQHFVRDALSALGINEPPRFSGQLNDYLERLKQGRLEVPADFKNHDTLDAYVERQLRAEPGSLTQHDMEYLLLHYYRIHLSSMPQNFDGEWKCSVPTCKCEFLTHHVDREALLDHSRREYGATLPPIAPIPEEPRTVQGAITVAEGATNEASEGNGSEMPREEEQPSEEERRRQQIAQDEETARRLAGNIEQEGMYERHLHRGYHSRVVSKVSRLPGYNERSPREIDETATKLSEVEEFRSEYDCFPIPVEITSRGYAMDAVNDKVLIDSDLLHRVTAESRVRHRYDSVSKFPVKLVLQVRRVDPPESIYDAQLVPALFVFDHLFEWNDASLVIPKRVDFKTQPPVLMTSFLYGSKWSSYVTDRQSKVKKVVRSPTEKLHRREIDLLFSLTTKKDGMFTAIIATSIDYNRNKTYHRNDCHNGHFLGDVMAAIGVKKLPAEVGDTLGNVLSSLRQECAGGSLHRTDFVDHADLDSFVQSRCVERTLSQLRISDIKFLILRYFIFHVRDWELANYPEQWTCASVDCQLPHLEEELDRLSLCSDKKCVIM